MKRCPKCNRTFETDTQKFCTHDGGLLFSIDVEMSDTVEFDSAKIRDAVAKPTTRDLVAPPAAQFDPEATVVSSAADETTVEQPRDTADLAPPPATQHQTPTPTPSGPIPPAPTSAPFPPPHTPSGPIAPSAPPAAQSAAQPQSSQPLPPSRPAKKSKVPLVLGILAVLFVLGIGVIVATYFMVVRPMLPAQSTSPPVTIESRPSDRPSDSAPPSEASKPPGAVEAYVPPPDAVQFVNSKANLDGKLLENYIDFSFYYPERWTKVPSPGNFIKVERRLPPDFTQENFAVAPWYADDTVVADNAFFRKLVEKDDADFARKFPEYRKVSEGPTKVGAYDAYEFRFEGVSRGTDKGDVTLWGREIFFPPRAGEKTGLKFLILTTSLAPELRSADDAGVKGELPMLLESFRFGKN